ncbi:MAG: O-antigen polymerase [Agathobacter sp.]
MGNIALFMGLVILEIISIKLYKDFLSPACLVCESFLLAFICSCFSSYLGGWNFNLHMSTVAIILSGLFCFFFGSFVADGTKVYKNNDTQIEYINPEVNKLIIMLVVQVILLGLYLIYYRRTIAQFGGMNWFSMIRAYRFTGAYGDGLDVSIPGWVNQIIKIARANGYLALYILMHNVAVRKFIGGRMPHIFLLTAILILYLPYNILNAARFELMVVLTMGLVVWYTLYRRCSGIVGKKKRNMRKAIRKIAIVVVIAMAGFSAIAPLVGRTHSDGIISQAADYFGRSMQAFDNFVENPTFVDEFADSETLYNAVKFLKQIHLVDGKIGKLYLEFTSQNGYSLGNTYTAFRRYYADIGMAGVVLFSILCGFILTYAYRKTKNPTVGHIDFGMLCYSSIIFSAFLYCYEEYFLTTIFSFNYLVIFVCLYFVSKWVSGEMFFSKGKMILSRSPDYR